MRVVGDLPLTEDLFRYLGACLTSHPGDIERMPRILVVEDDADLQFLYERSFAYLGYEVVTAQTAGDGISQLQDDAFDLVILDMNLPDMPGINVAKHMTSKGVESPVVVISANEFWRLQCGELGIDNFLVKPVRLAELRSVVGNMLTH